MSAGSELAAEIHKQIKTPPRREAKHLRTDTPVSTPQQREICSADLETHVGHRRARVSCLGYVRPGHSVSKPRQSTILNRGATIDMVQFEPRNKNLPDPAVARCRIDAYATCLYGRPCASVQAPLPTPAGNRSLAAYRDAHRRRPTAHPIWRRMSASPDGMPTHGQARDCVCTVQRHARRRARANT